MQVPLLLAFRFEKRPYSNNINMQIKLAFLFILHILSRTMALEKSSVRLHRELADTDTKNLKFRCNANSQFCNPLNLLVGYHVNRLHAFVLSYSGLAWFRTYLKRPQHHYFLYFRHINHKQLYLQIEFLLTPRTSDRASDRILPMWVVGSVAISTLTHASQF